MRCLVLCTQLTVSIGRSPAHPHPPAQPASSATKITQTYRTGLDPMQAAGASAGPKALHRAAHQAIASCADRAAASTSLALWTVLLSNNMPAEHDRQGLHCKPACYHAAWRMQPTHTCMHACRPNSPPPSRCVCSVHDGHHACLPRLSL